MSLNNEDIRKQVEYYLSDSNLVHDEFFHKEITNSEGGYLGLHHILKCNKITKLNVANVKQLADAIEGSQILELNDAKTSVRRKGQKPLPVLQAKDKKLKLNSQEAKVVQQTNGDEVVPVENPYSDFEPLIFGLKAPEGIQCTWGQISEGLTHKYNISAPYVRYGKTEGNFILNKKRTPQENIVKLTTEGIKVGEHIIAVNVLTEEELTQFYAHHGKHFEGILKRAKDSFSNKPSKEQKRFSQKGKAKELVFHNQRYKDVNQLKTVFKTILARSQNDVPLKEPYHSMLIELLQFHEKKDKKINDFKHFTVGPHPEHKDTRCFMIVKNDDTVEDFSCIKCIANLQEQLEKE